MFGKGEANLVGVNDLTITFKRTLASCNRHTASRHAPQCLTDLLPSKAKQETIFVFRQLVVATSSSSSYSVVLQSSLKRSLFHSCFIYKWSWLVGESTEIWGRCEKTRWPSQISELESEQSSSRARLPKACMADSCKTKFPKGRTFCWNKNNSGKNSSTYVEKK